MKRPFEDDTFKTLVMSDELLAKRDVLAKAVDDWRNAESHRRCRPRSRVLAAERYNPREGLSGHQAGHEQLCVRSEHRPCDLQVRRRRAARRV
jgi:hypothetical protein